MDELTKQVESLRLTILLKCFWLYISNLVSKCCIVYTTSQEEGALGEGEEEAGREIGALISYRSAGAL